MALAVAILLPFGAIAQEELTVADGTATNAYVPFYGYWADYNQHVQLIYPASMLEEAAGGTIQSLTFYSTSTTSYVSSGTFVVSLGTTTVNSWATSNGDLLAADDLEEVFSGTLTMNGQNVEIEFETPFAYAGDNLLVDIVYTSTSSIYGQTAFYGQNQTSYTGRNSYGSSNNQGCQFLPKATFAYTADGGNICRKPGNLTIDEIGATGATASWSPRGEETEWAIYLGDSLVTTWYDSTYTFDDLNSSTVYTVRVRAVCGDGDTSSYTTASFATSCVAIATESLPWTEGFESWGTTASDFPSCWDRFYWNGYSLLTNSHPYASTAQAHNGTKSIRMYANYEDDDWDYMPGINPTPLTANYDYSEEFSALYLPIFESPVQALTLKFWMKVPTDYDDFDLLVGVSSTTADTSDFTRLAKINATDGDWHQYEVDLAQYIGTGNRITFVFESNYWYYTTYYAYIDDITIESLGDCTRPANVTFSDISSTSATISWTEMNEVGDYRVTLGENIATVSGETSLTVDTLQPNTVYTVSVSRLCDTAYTEERTATFRTDCAPYAHTALPWTDDFQAYTSEFTGSGHQFNLPCYNVLNSYISYGTTNYPYVNTYNNHGGSGGNCIISGNYTSYSNKAPIVVLPDFEDAIDQLQLSFFAKISYGNPTAFEVGYITDAYNDSTFMPTDTVMLTTDWEYYEHVFPTVDNARIALRFGAATIYVDDITVSERTACSRPNSFSMTANTTTSITISVNDPGNTGSYRVYYNVLNSTDTASADFTDTAYTISGLTAGTLYELSLVAVCEGGATTYPLSITAATACEVLTHADLPYSEGFEGYATGAGNSINPCWNVFTLYTSNNAPYASSSYAHSGSNSLYFYPGYAGQDAYAVMPEIDDVSDLYVSFWVRSFSYSYATIDVGVMTDPAVDSTFTLVQTCTPSGSQYEQFEVMFNNYTGTGKYIAFRARTTNSSYGYAYYIDDVVLSSASGCVSEINNVSISAVSSNSATISWTTNIGTADSYTITATPASGNALTFSTTASPYTMTGLSASTTYNVTVSAICDGSAAATSQAASFTTRPEGISEIEVSAATNSYEVSTSQNYLPVTPNYNNSASQQVFKASELGSAFTLNGISFNYVGTNPMTHYDICTVYVAHIADSTIDAWVDPAQMTQVYSGALDMQAGWNDFFFSNTFDYNGTDNLLLCVVGKTSTSWVGGSTWFSQHSAWTNAAIYYCNDNTEFSAATSTANPISRRNDVKFFTTGGSTPGPQPQPCDAPTVTNATSTTSSVTLTWTSTESNFEVAIVAGTWSEPASTNSASGTQYTFNNLSAGTQYTAGVRTVCDDGQYSAWATRTITTDTTGGSHEGIDDVDGMVFGLYPNPASTTVTIEVGTDAKVSLLDMSGRTVMNSTVSGSATIDVSELSRGTYFVRVSSNEATAVRKLIVH